MYSSEFFNPSFWLICTILMIAMCFFMMRVRRDYLMSGCGSRDTDSQHISVSDSTMDILDKRYALGGIDKKEYEEKKNALNQ